MEKEFHRVTFNLKALDVDSSARKVKVSIAELETVDEHGEVFEPTAFDKTIAERGPKGKNAIWHMVDHGGAPLQARSLEKALSKFEELNREGKYINGVSPYRDTWLWREVVWPLYEAGDINQHSVGVLTSTKDIQRKATHKILKQVTLLEGSAVWAGANGDTPTQAIYKSLLREKEESAADRIEWICKAITEGRYRGEEESLLIIELKQLENLYTIPEPSPQDTPPIEPEDKPLIKALEPEAILSFIEIQKQLLTTQMNYS